MPGPVLFKLLANVFFLPPVRLPANVLLFFFHFVLPVSCLINDEINMMYYLGSVLSIEVTVKTSEFGRISKGLFVLTKGKIELKTSVISVIDISATGLVFYFYCLLNNLVSDCFETFAVLITSNILLRLSLGSYSCFQAKPKLSLKLISNDLGLRTAAIYVKTD